MSIVMEDGMKEIRIHGRGGQGAVTAVRILAAAFVLFFLAVSFQ